MHKKILIIGAGGIGGYYGARLQQDGHDVHFIARGQHAAAMTQNGLRVASGLGDFHLPRVNVSAAIPDGQSFDLCLIAVKNYDLADAYALLDGRINTDCALLNLQNGLWANEETRRRFPDNPHLAGLTYINANINGAGHIEHHAKRAEIHIGADNIPYDDVENWAKILINAGMRVTAHSDIMPIVWDKFVFIAVMAGISTYLDKTADQIVLSDDDMNMVRAGFSEGAAVMAAYIKGITPEEKAAGHIKLFSALPAGSTASMHKDFKSNPARTELAWLTQDLYARATAHHLAVPVLQKVVEGLQQRVQNV